MGWDLLAMSGEERARSAVMRGWWPLTPPCSCPISPPHVVHEKNQNGLSVSPGPCPSRGMAGEAFWRAGR